MRPFLPLLLLTVTACSVDSDAANEQVTLEYNKQQIRDTAVKAGRSARNAAASFGNVVSATGRAIHNEVGSVEVDVRRTPPPKSE